MEDRMKLERYTLFDERRTVFKFTVDDKVMEDALGPGRRQWLRVIEEFGFPVTAVALMVAAIATDLEGQKHLDKEA